MTAEKKHEIPLWRIIFSGATLTALAYIIVGIVLVARPQITYTSLCYVAATAVMLIGLIDVIRYILRGISEGKLNNYLSRGLILVIISVFMFVRDDYVVIVLPTLLSLAILIDGIIKLQRSVDLLRLKDDGWIFVLILAVLAIISGGILVFRSSESTQMVMAIALIYCGVTSLVVSIFVHSKLRKYREKQLSGELDERPVLPSEEAPAPQSVVPDMTDKQAIAESTEAEPIPVQPVMEEEPDEEIKWQPIPVSMPAAAEALLEAEENSQAEVLPERTFDPMEGISFGDEEDRLEKIENEKQEKPMEAAEGEIPFENIEI